MTTRLETFNSKGCGHAEAIICDIFGDNFSSCLHLLYKSGFMVRNDDFEFFCQVPLVKFSVISDFKIHDGNRAIQKINNFQSQG